MNKTLPVTTIEKGHYGGLGEAATFVIKNKRDWDKLLGVDKDLPDVNFRKHVLVALFREQCSSGGYGIKVIAAHIEGVHQPSKSGKLVSIFYEYTNPEPGYMYTQALTTPYLIVALPKKRKTQYQPMLCFQRPATPYETSKDISQDEAARKQRADSLRKQIDKLVQGKE